MPQSSYFNKKGLLDAMSAFGVKTPLRRAVVTDNPSYMYANVNLSYMYANVNPSYIYANVNPSYLYANDICEFLSDKFSNDNTKTLDGIWRNKQDFKINGCRVQHMFSFFPDGQVQSKVNISSCKSCLEGHFVQCSVEMGQIVQQSPLDSDISDGRDIEYEDDDCPRF